MEIGNLAGKASELLGEHGDKVEAAVDKVGEFAKEKFGHAEQIDAGVEKIKGLIPGGEGEADGEPAPAEQPAPAE